MAAQLGVEPNPSPSEGIMVLETIGTAACIWAIVLAATAISMWSIALHACCSAD